MATLADSDKKIIDRLVAEGKGCSEIRDQLNIYLYVDIYRYINRQAMSQAEKEKRAKKVKPIIAMPNGKYVPTGFPMPPTNPPKPMTVIIDKELAEVACRGLGLKPPVTKLKNRPATYHRNGVQWDGKKWAVKSDLWNEGMVLSRGPEWRSNT